jgi:hypothetical protein
VEIPILRSYGFSLLQLELFECLPLRLIGWADALAAGAIRHEPLTRMTVYTRAALVPLRGFRQLGLELFAGGLHIRVVFSSELVQPLCMIRAGMATGV